MMTFLLLYFVPIAIIFTICYIAMDKDETVDEYLKRTDGEVYCILTFLPVINILLSTMIMFLFVFGIFSMIGEFTIDKIKNIRK